MDWSGTLGIIIAGVAGLFAISLMFWIGHALLKQLEADTPQEPLIHSMVNQPAHEDPDCLPVPDGEERLATQSERDDVNERIERSKSAPAGEAVRL